MSEMTPTAVLLSSFDSAVLWRRSTLDRCPLYVTGWRGKRASAKDWIVCSYAPATTRAPTRLAFPWDCTPPLIGPASKAPAFDLRTSTVPPWATSSAHKRPFTVSAWLGPHRLAPLPESFPDAKPQFFETMGRACPWGGAGRFRHRCAVCLDGKSEVIRLGVELALPLELTLHDDPQGGASLRGIQQVPRTPRAFAMRLADPTVRVSRSDKSHKGTKPVSIRPQRTPSTDHVGRSCFLTRRTEKSPYNPPSWHDARPADACRRLEVFSLLGGRHG